MKVQLTIDLILPDDCQEMNDAEISQVLFDGYTNYVTVSHARDAVKWCARGKIGSDNEDKVAKHIYKYHETWRNVADQAVWTFERKDK